MLKIWGPSNRGKVPQLELWIFGGAVQHFQNKSKTANKLKMFGGKMEIAWYLFYL